MSIYRNAEHTICFETNKRQKDFILHKGGNPIPESEAYLISCVKVNVGYLKQIINLLDEKDKVKISVGKEDTPLHLEVKNKFKGVIAPVLDVEE